MGLGGLRERCWVVEENIGVAPKHLAYNELKACDRVSVGLAHMKTAKLPMKI